MRHTNLDEGGGGATTENPINRKKDLILRREVRRDVDFNVVLFLFLKMCEGSHEK